MNELIHNIHKSINVLFKDGIYFSQKGIGKYVSNGGNQAIAYNYYRNEVIPINVVRWFDEFWIYIEINFKKISIEANLASENQKGISKKDFIQQLSKNSIKFGNDYFQTFITISVFQGDYSLESKRQLFRAEWDNFNNQDEMHPQPHWQYYTRNNHLDKLETMGNESFMNEINNDVGDTFNDEVKLKENVINRIHFAMNGQWSNNGSHIHKICDKDALICWFYGLLNHIKFQLEYLKR